MPTNNSLFLNFPPEGNVTPDGDVLYTPEELANGPSIPPSSANVPDSVYRLCEYDEESQTGCRRTNTIFALEAEYNTFVHPEMYWGDWDQFCRHEGHIYYYKYFIENQLLNDQATYQADQENAVYAEQHAVVIQHLGAGFRRHTIEEIVEFFRNPPAGFPEYVSETLQFFQCVDIGQSPISIDELDRTLLTKIQETFTDDVHPLLGNVSGTLYQFNDKIYCSDYSAFTNNPAYKLGVLMIPTESTKYQVGNAYFFPFSTLTEDQKTLITSLGLLDLELQGNVVFVDL